MIGLLPLITISHRFEICAHFRLRIEDTLPREQSMAMLILGLVGLRAGGDLGLRSYGRRMAGECSGGGGGGGGRQNMKDFRFRDRVRVRPTHKHKAMPLSPTSSKP